MTTSASITIDAADITDQGLFCDHTDSISGTWSIRLVDKTGHQLWMQGTVAEFDEALARLGEHIVTLRQRVREKESLADARRIAHLAGIETEVTQ